MCVTHAKAARAPSVGAPGIGDLRKSVENSFGAPREHMRIHRSTLTFDAWDQEIVYTGIPTFY